VIFIFAVVEAVGSISPSVFKAGLLVLLGDSSPDGVLIFPEANSDCTGDREVGAGEKIALT
jgi:hypothetical protein